MHPNDDDDDFFGQQEDEEDGLAEREAQATNERYRTLGYHETYEKSQESALQEGFNNGYKETFAQAMRIGQILGEQVARVKIQRPPQQQNSEEQIADAQQVYLRVANVVRQALLAEEGGNDQETNRPQGLEELEGTVRCLVEKAYSDKD